MSGFFLPSPLPPLFQHRTFLWRFVRVGLGWGGRGEFIWLQIYEVSLPLLFYNARLSHQALLHHIHRHILTVVSYISFHFVNVEEGQWSLRPFVFLAGVRGLARFGRTWSGCLTSPCRLPELIVPLFDGCFNLPDRSLQLHL